MGLSLSLGLHLGSAALNAGGGPHPSAGAVILAWDNEFGVQQLIQWDDENGNPQYLEWDIE